VLVLGLCGAAAVPVLLYAPGHLSDRSAMFARARALCTRVWPLALALACVFRPVVDPLWGAWTLMAGLGGLVWLGRRRDGDAVSGAQWPWDVLAFAVPMALYLSTLAPSVLPGDSGEFQFVTAILGIPHPTGYPLYLVLGKLFSLLPIRSVAYRLNLLSAVAAAATVWAVYRTGRALGLRRPASLIGAALLMVGETFWSQATIAEKYTLNTFFVALTLWLGLQWQRERRAGHSGSRWLSTWALCYGLSLAHHRTMILLAPAYLWLVWSTDRSVFRPRSVLRVASWFAAPFSLYLLLPLFSALDPPYAYVRVNSAKAFWDLVLARMYQGGVFQGGWSGLPDRLAESGRMLVRQFGPVGLGLAIAGWLALLRRNVRVAWALLIGILAQVAFALNYYVPNAFVYYLPAYVWLALCVSVTVDAGLTAIPWLDSGQRTRRGEGRCASPSRAGAASHLALVWVLMATALPVGLCATRWPRMDRQRAYNYLAFDHTYGQMAAHSIESGALLVSDWLPATVLWYVQFVEGLAPTVQVAVADPLEGQWARFVENALAAERPVYLARPLMAAGDRYALASAGPLVRVLAAPETSPPQMSHPLDAGLEGGLRLLGCDLVATAPGPEGALYSPSDALVEGGSTLHATFYWQAVDVPDGDYAVTVRLIDASGYVWLERRRRHPVGGTYPTSRWKPGEVVADAYELVLPPSLSSGEYRLQATIGVPFAERGLRDRSGSDELTCAVINVHKPLRWPDAALSTSVRKGFSGGLMLTGYDAPSEVIPGEMVSAALQWLVCGPQDADLRPLLVLVKQGGVRSVVEPLPGAAEDWVPGALVVERYAFSVPDDLVSVEVRAGRSLAWGTPSHRLRIRVTTAPPPVADFGDLIRLRGYTYETESLKAGDAVRLTLEWEAIRAVDEPYKVFVHVLGQHGLPIAQQDNEPVNGTYPTTRWRSGERISDPYAIALPADLAPGEYRVEVGLYRIADMSRLPVLDQDRSVVDDKVFLAPLSVE